MNKKRKLRISQKEAAIKFFDELKEDNVQQMKKKYRNKSFGDMPIEDKEEHHFFT